MRPLSAALPAASTRLGVEPPAGAKAVGLCVSEENVLPEGSGAGTALPGLVTPHKSPESSSAPSSPTTSEGAGTLRIRADYTLCIPTEAKTALQGLCALLVSQEKLLLVFLLLLPLFLLSSPSAVFAHSL